MAATTLRTRRTALFGATLLVVACAAWADEPWSVIDGGDWPKTEPYAAPVMIASIDGKDRLREQRRSLAPGKHHLEFVTTRKTRTHKQQQTRAVDLELKPCTAYYFYAQHPSKFADEWELKVLRETALKGCP